MAPAVDGFAVALDVVPDDFVAVQVEVRLDGGELGLEVIVVTTDIAKLAAEGRMAEQGAAALRIERAGELHRDVLGVERFARADLAAGQELTRVFAVHHHRAHGVGHRDALDEHVTDAAMDEHAGVDILHQPAGQVVMGGVEVDGALAGDADAGDGLRLTTVADADAVGLRGVVGHEPQAAGAVAGLVREADLHPVAEFLPVARDGDALVGRLEEFAVAPGDGVGGAVLTAGDDDRVDRTAEELGAVDLAFLHIVGATDLEVIDLLARILVGRDLADAFLVTDAIGQLERRTGHQFDLDGLVDVQDRAVLLEAVLMQARQEGELIAGCGRIHHGLRVVARLDLMFGREEGGREKEGEETHDRGRGRGRGGENQRGDKGLA